MASEVAVAASAAVPAQDQSDQAQPNGKRKPSRRANTAERRATHNAVERQRRETLNSRFLDLAALLPNLSQIRRPSKSSIVNSSIAHIHASRRHRLLASRELRVLKIEADALRREVNEWRGRSGIPHIEEPPRGEGFSMVLSGELEALVVPGMVGGFGMEDEEDDYPSGNYTYDDHPPEMVKNANAHPFAHPLPPNDSPSPVSNASSSPPYRPSISVPTQPVMGGGPIIASPTSMSFDNPAMAGVYTPADSHIPHQHVIYHPSGYIHPHHLPPQPVVDAEKVAHWNMMQQHQGMNPDQAYLASLAARRGRSASMSTGSRSSGSASPVQTYEVPPAQFDAGFEQPAYEGQWTGGPKHQQPVFAMMI